MLREVLSRTETRKGTHRRKKDREEFQGLDVREIDEKRNFIPYLRLLYKPQSLTDYPLQFQAGLEFL